MINDKNLNMIILKHFLFFLSFSLPFTAFSQCSFTANDKVIPYKGSFGYGSNMGYYPPWTDEQLADIGFGDPSKNIPGVGVTSLRPALYEYYLEKYGYDHRLSTFQHYQQLGYQNLTVFIGYPCETHRDKNQYAQDGSPSKMFANIYEPIWDDGKDGTPINEENYMAKYVYQLVQRYGAYIKYYEVWNEPDFDKSGNAWKRKGKTGNWWDQDPSPSDLHNLKAPIQHYIRALRISWEVIKYLEPDAYVCIGGIGYSSFLDAVLRNTDNPDVGKQSDEFPLKGGAYFDVLSYHVCPHFYLKKRKWFGYEYNRHSAAAVQEMISKKNKLA